MKQLKTFENYVKEAQREPLELPLPDGTSVQIEFPTGGQLKAFRHSIAINDADGCVVALFGAEQSERLIALFDDAPGDVLIKIMHDMAEEFGIQGEMTG